MTLRQPLCSLIRRLTSQWRPSRHAESYFGSLHVSNLAMQRHTLQRLCNLDHHVQANLHTKFESHRLQHQSLDGEYLLSFVFQHAWVDRGGIDVASFDEMRESQGV